MLVFFLRLGRLFSYYVFKHVLCLSLFSFWDLYNVSGPDVVSEVF